MLRIVLFAGICQSVALARPTATFIPLSLPPEALGSIGFGISSDGRVVVGTVEYPGPPYARALRYTPLEGVTFLDPPPTNSGALYATALSGDGGTISVVSVGNTEGPRDLTFAYGPVGSPQPLGPFPIDPALGVEVSVAGAGVTFGGSTIVGVWGPGDSPEVPAFAHGLAFVWEAGVVSILDDLPGGGAVYYNSGANAVSADGRVLVGYADGLNGSDPRAYTQAAVWRRFDDQYVLSGLGTLPGPYANSRAVNVSANGLVIVGWADTVKGREPFRWNELVGMRSLGQPPAPDRVSGIAMDVADDGVTVVGSWATGFMPWYEAAGEAYVWVGDDGGQALRDILDLGQPLDLTGWTLTAIRGISASGRSMVGTGWAPDGRMQAWVVRFPEFTTPGDLNCSGAVNFADIDPMVLALTSAEAYTDAFPECSHAMADVNGDEAVNFGDIDPFVALLTGV